MLKSPQLRDSYSKVSSQVREFTIRHPKLVDAIADKTGFSKHEVQDLLERSTTIITFTTLMGMDVSTRLPGANVLQGALLGMGIGICLVIGQITIKLWLSRHNHELVLELAQ